MMYMNNDYQTFLRFGQKRVIVTEQNFTVNDLLTADKNLRNGSRKAYFDLFTEGDIRRLEILSQRYSPDVQNRVAHLLAGPRKRIQNTLGVEMDICS